MDNKPIIERLKSDKQMSYFHDFIDSLDALLSVVWGENWGELTMNHPMTLQSKEQDVPVIVYSLKERRPGRVGNDTREIKPRSRGQSTFVNQQGEKEAVEVLGQWMDYIIDFTIVAENNREVLKWTHRFVEALREYKGILMKDGMQNLWFEREFEEGTNGTGKDDLATRGVTYHLRLEELHIVNKSILESIRVEVELMRKKRMKEKTLPSQRD